MKSYEEEFEPGQDNPEDSSKRPFDVFLSWFFVCGVVTAIAGAAYWLKENVSF